MIALTSPSVVGLIVAVPLVVSMVLPGWKTV